MKDKKMWYKKLSPYVLGIIILIIPIGINETYKYGNRIKNPYITSWSATDVLSFYGSLLAFIGTVFLGLVSYRQNEKAHEQTRRSETITLKMLNLEECNKKIFPIPFYDISMEVLEKPYFNETINVEYGATIEIIHKNFNELPIIKFELLLPGVSIINSNSRKAFISDSEGNGLVSIGTIILNEKSTTIVPNGNIIKTVIGIPEKYIRRDEKEKELCALIKYRYKCVSVYGYKTEAYVTLTADLIYDVKRNKYKGKVNIFAYDIQFDGLT